MELFGRTDVNVRRIAWGATRARVLEFDWVVPANHALGTPWTDYPVVTYTDPAHPAYNFKGKAIEPARQYKAGQSIRVVCADVWRTWERQTARLACSATTPAYPAPGTSKIRIREGVTVAEAITTIVDQVTGDIPGGLSISLPNVTDPPDLSSPLTVVDRGEFNRFVAAPGYAINDIVTHKGITYICTVPIPASPSMLAPDQNPAWDWYFPYSPTPHAPILYLAQDKTGQKIATWIHDLLDQTENGIALIDYPTGSPRLHVYDYTSKPAVTLQVGSFDVINPNATTPLLQSGEMKLSQNNKYEKIIVEGAGIYTRHVGVSITPTYYGHELLPGDNLVHHFRFYFPETNILGLFLDVQNQLFDRIFYRFAITTHPNGATVQTNYGQQVLGVLQTDGNRKNPDGSNNANYGKFYADFDLYTVPNDTGEPTFDINEWRYTSYDGPLLVTEASTDADLAGAGDFPVHMPLFYKFTNPGFVWIQRTGDSGTIDIFGDYSILPGITGDVVQILEAKCNRDYTTRAKMLAKAYFKRYSNGPDHSGSLTVIVKGVTGNIDIGTALSNFNNARVSDIDYDPSKQTLKLQVSDQPIRAFTERFRDYQTQRSELYGNARNRPRPQNDQLFPDVTLNDLCLIVDPPLFTPALY